MTSIFLLVPSLPAEFRHQIWQDALPDKIHQPLYFYQKGCWFPCLLTESDPDYDFENSHLNLNFEFRHELLDDVEFIVQLFHVNREARGFALAWVREQGLTIRFHKERKNVNYPGPAFTRVATPEALLRNEINPLYEVFDYYVSIREEFVIVDAQPDLDMQPEDDGEDDGMKLQRRWEIAGSAQGARFFWNSDCGEFEWAGREDLGDKGLCKFIEEASNGVGEKLVENGRMCLRSGLSLLLGDE